MATFGCEEDVQRMSEHQQEVGTGEDVYAANRIALTRFATALVGPSDAADVASDTIVYIGTISDVDGFVYGVNIDGGTTEVCQSASWWLNDASFTSCFPLARPELSKSIGMASGAEIGIVVAVTALDDEVSIVGIELPSGQRYWQRPVAGSVMFATDDPGVLVSITITTYDAKGNPLTTELFNPNA